MFSHLIALAARNGEQMRHIASVLLVGLAIGIAAPAAHAQRPEEFFQRELFFEKDVRQRLEAVTPTDQKALIEWGGFYAPSYTYFTDLGGNGGHMTLQDFRLWTQIQFDQIHRVFARMRLAYTDFAAGDAEGFRQHDLHGPNLEVGYYELNVSRAAEKYAGAKWPCEMLIRGGRQYIEVGRGIALGRILDAGWFNIETKDLAFMGFAGRTPPREENIDRSAPGYPNSRRNFYGGQLRYRGCEQHEPYGFFVIQRDWSDETPENPFQDFRYNSQYYGVGSRGVVVKNLHYALESLWEFGRGAANGQSEGLSKVRAYAFDGELDYYFQHPLKPVATFEYGYASGDGDRTSATTAIGGNRLGTVDTEFQGFGYVNSGLALAARFSNIQFVRLSGRATPYDNKACGGRIDVGLDYYFLWKADREGPISDTQANRASAELGEEVDLYVEWRILSDLSLTIRYGHFFRGAAYSFKDGQDFLFTGLNFSF